MSNSNSLLEGLRRQHAAGLGIPQERVELVQLDLDILNQLGTFVRISARGLTMFSTQATWTELGIPGRSARQLRYRKPPKDLVPREITEWFRNAAQRARSNLESVSQEVDFMHPYRWIGAAHWRDWLARFEQDRERWIAYRQSAVLDRYDELVQLLVEDFQHSAEEAYRVLKETGEPNLPSRDDFVAGVVRATVARMPTPQQIERNLTLDHFTPAIVRPALLEAELAQRDRVRREREQEAAAAAAQQQARMELLALEHQAEMDARRAEMYAQRLEHYRRQVEATSLPLQQVLEALRREIADVAQDTLAVLKEHGGLRGRAGERVRNLAESVRMLDALGDQELMNFVREAAGLAQAIPDEQDEQKAARVAALTGVLEQIRGLLEVEAQARQAVALLAQESGQRRWRSICLGCRHVWASTGSLEPALCPRCKGNRVASREEDRGNGGIYA